VRILLLSAYHASSHQRWCDGLMAHLPEFDWTCLTLPPRYFSWRIRGNSLSWAFNERERLSAGYDLVVATAMVDLSALRGFVPALAAIPTLVYFHENQFAYPPGSAQRQSVEPQILNLYTALCADRILFNSHFNRDTFLAGVADLCRKLPDQVPAGLDVQLCQRSAVLPVPLEADCFTHPLPRAQRLQLVWNHRWEYDKGPERLLLALQGMTDLAFTLHMVGQQFRRQPAEFAAIQTELQRRGALGQWGYMASRLAYRQLLQRCHGVISTALHDFQGLAVMEAVAAGCVPLVPARQAYPEWFGAASCYASELSNPAAEAAALRAAVAQLAAHRDSPAPSLHHCSWTALAPRYRQELMALG
jgi:glycosyltransferase involved in cell wall biosynthesis